MTGFRNDMSVKEKLYLGFSQSFRETLEFNTQVGHATDRQLSSDQNEMSHLEFTPCHDRGLGGSSSSLQQKTMVQDVELQDRMYRFPVKESVFRETMYEPRYDYPEERKRLIEHFLAKSRFVESAHKRLAAVIRPRSKQIHTVPGLVARRRPGQIMNIEWQQEYHGFAMGMSFSAFQGKSMEANGYQKRGIRYLHFQKVDDVYRTFPGPPLITATAEDYRASFSTEMFFQDGIDGNISMTELDITDINGRKRRWICIEMSRPLVQATGPVPSELIPMPCSYLKISAPYDKVSITTNLMKFDERLNLSRSPQLGNFKRLTVQGHGRGTDAYRVRLRLCSDGVPIFATGSKKCMPFANRTEDFLFVKNVNGLPWKETDRRVSNATKAMRKHEFWERCRSAAEVDKARWKSLQDAMARDDCVVDITFEGEWDKVGPSVQMSQEVARTPTAVPQTGLSPFVHPLRAQDAGKGRASSSGSCRAKDSGLRNEVKF
ncbi:uncharacterized protein LY79DRAFT_627009 [Colletotrichum navitas]|uniref:Uncharacterized protein n=1 Tax=Colletotrichum navitas TaxID=681940 RepID=A0AAD8Q660_9PEZI|nr:uncharacterized protein LY79DRAFT_627009 [Colletotrichum navitas]KAK1595991.1 hypothetical protein LY79DRAFT_627009 [Colletotrichum navitas]